MNTRIIILAAGNSSRLGTPKQQVPWNHQTLLQFAVQQAIQSRASDVSVVLGFEHEKMLADLQGMEVSTIYNTEWMTGMAGSIVKGVERAITDSSINNVIIAVCDQPHLTTSIYNELLKFEMTDNIVASKYDNGAFGVPVLFPRSLFDELTGLTGDEGAKKVIMRHPERLALVDFPLGYRDIDTPGDLDFMVS